MKKLADNEELGNPVAHFFKSGNVLRSKDNDRLTQLKSLMPEKWIKDTKVEYDVWYSFDGPKIHGYVYTDVLTQFLYLRVASCMRATAAMQKAAQVDITEEGERLFSEIADNSGDKYRLRAKGIKEDFVIFLPGTNILNKVVNWGRIDNAMSQGAKLKCHPLTAAPAYEHLVHKYGADSVIEKKASGQEILNNATIVGCCDNSEMGIAALAKGKTVYRFGSDSEWCTYSAIYRALMDKGQLRQDRLKAILSCKDSGLIPTSIDYPTERINRFFLQYSQEEHVAPKNFSGRVQQVNRVNG